MSATWRRLGLGLACLVLLAGGAVRPVHAADNVVLRWNEATLQAIRDTRLGPPMAARALAVVHTSMFDAWSAYDGIAIGTRLGGTLRRPLAERTSANKERAISYAAYRSLVDLFPGLKTDFNAVMNGLGHNPTDASIDTATPTGIGNVAAAEVIAFRHRDGSNQLGDRVLGAYVDYTEYRPINTVDLVIDPNRWQPLRFSDGAGGTVTPRFVGPHWGSVIPFALTSGDQLRPEPPALYPDPRYLAQSRELLELSAGLTDREKMIAEYWADGPASETPPGHWNLFAQLVSRRDGHTVDQDVTLFFALNNALLDASIAVWDAKRHYDYVRPITAIRFLYRGEQVAAWCGPYGGTCLIDGGDWMPYQPLTFVTPPFAEYVSGHSTFSAASAEVLKQFTGSDAFDATVALPPGSSRIEPGLVPAAPVTLAWATFSEAADQAGMSRRYGGIHFRDGDLEGRGMGRRVGVQAWQTALRYVAGTVAP